MINTGATAAVKQYRQLSTRGEIDEATPHRLIQMMMQRVLTRVTLARKFMEQGSIGEKGRNIGDAIDVISGLQASLNHEPNARLAGNFDALYDYMTRRLLEANVRDEPTILDEVSGLMAELKEAWDAIADEVASPTDGAPQLTKE